MAQQEVQGSKSFEQGVSLYADAFGGGSCVNSEQDAASADNQYGQKRAEEKTVMGEASEGREKFEQQVSIERRNQLIHDDKPQGERKQPDALEAIAFRRQMDMMQHMQDSQME